MRPATTYRWSHFKRSGKAPPHCPEIADTDVIRRVAHQIGPPLESVQIVYNLDGLRQIKSHADD
jgi:hypothetical protein